MLAMRRIAKRAGRTEDTENTTRRSIFRAHRPRRAALVMLQHHGALRALADEPVRLSFGYPMFDLEH